MITTQSNRSFIESEQYSDFILRNLHDGMLPQNFYRNVSDFGEGETLNIKSIGEAKLQMVDEDTPLEYNPIESGNVQLQITDYPGDAWYITDVMRQDGSQIPALLAARADESRYALQQFVESRAYETLNAGQTDGQPNTINGFPHRIASSETNNVANVETFSRMKLAFDKAEVPLAGRIAIVDPVVAATLQEQFQGSYNVDSNPMMQEILNTGFDREHQFIMNLFGWNIMTSNRLPRGSFSDGTTTVTNGVANLFMSVASDQTKPLMMAWRQMPKTESERNKDLQRDEFIMTARWGYGVQRVDTLGVYITSETNV